MARGIFFLLSALVCLLAQPVVHAQNVGAGLDTERFKPAIDSQGLIITEAGHGEKRGELNLGFYLHYSRNPLVLTSGDTVVRNLISDRLAGNFCFSTGVSDWLTLGVDVPAVFQQEGSLLDQETGAPVSLAGAVLGDIRFVPKLTLGRAISSGLSVALLTPVTFPSGDESSLYGNRGVTISPTLAISGNLFNNRLILALNAGIWFQKDSGYADLEVSHEAFYRLGTGIRFTERFLVMGELLGGGRMANLFENPSKETPLEGVMGIRYHTPADIILTAGAASGILKGWGTPNYRAFIGLTWAPRKHDKDNDGISDKNDRCPTDPGPKENFGCPWGDEDSDGLLDNQDQCPTEYGPVENHGCPWGDEDSDGTTDNLDKCPQDPGPAENNGCPWGDADQDGVKDNQDQCPEQAEDKDGFQDEDGCPDPDNDKDGLLDQEDKCPDDPETINGYQDDDGCPDEGKVVVIVKEEKIEILQKVHFATGKAAILSDSFGLLDQVALALKAHLEVKKVRVDGHTDSQGPEAYNQKLSEQRAEAVKTYLLEREVEPERLQVMGFGESQPIDVNSTARGRENNRRVEFTILERE